MKDRIIHSLVGLTKLGVAGGIIFGIGFTMVTQDPESSELGPAPAKADIQDFMGAPASKSAQFTEAMVAMGLKPRVYDFNGNVMYFAVGATERGVKPRQVLRKVQSHLVDFGINKADHSDMVPLQQSARAVNWDKATENESEMEKRFKPMVDKASLLINGEVVPTQVSDNYVEMVGYDKNRNPEDLTQLFAGDDSNRKVGNLMGGYKYIDAYYQPEDDTTQISAVWSAEDFSAERMNGEGNDQSPPDPAIPPCMGCKRDYRMQTIDRGDSYSGNMFSTNLDVNQTYDFYKSAMEQRGWHESGAQPVLDRMAKYMPELRAVNNDGRLLSLERDGQSMQLAIIPKDENNTQILTIHEGADAQAAHPEELD